MEMIEGSCVSGAYRLMLRDTLNSSGLLQVTKVRQPIIDDKVNFDLGTHCQFRDFRFPDGRTGEWWVQDRLDALLREKGEYWEPMRRHGQWDYVLSALKGMKEGTVPRWNSNRLIITLFDPSKDLHTSRAPTPPCLITLDFKPIKDTLSLVGTFRAQYTDAKGYGNLFSLAYLLLQVCEKTRFQPAELYSIAHKPILKYPIKTARSLLKSINGS